MKDKALDYVHSGNNNENTYIRSLLYRFRGKPGIASGCPCLLSFLLACLLERYLSFLDHHR